MAKARIWIVVCAALLLTGCQTTMPEATEAEKTSASMKTTMCLRDAIIRLDDHSSDAKTIAYAAAAACLVEFKDEIKAYTRFMGDDAFRRLRFEESAYPTHLAAATYLVLALRAKHVSDAR